MTDNLAWKTLDRILEIRSPWLKLIGEKIQDDRNKILDYWRIERADSAVIIPLYEGQFLLPVPTYRPGLGQRTLDFPGGRIPEGQAPETQVPAILQRELGVSATAIARLTPLNETGWAINSSFSNQKLYGFAAELSPETAINPERLGATYPTHPEGVRHLLRDLTCLQCRAVLLEWMLARDCSRSDRP